MTPIPFANVIMCHSTHQLHCRFAVAICAMLALPGAHAAIVEIAPGGIDDPKILDFASAPLGNISDTATLFTDFGISSISRTSNPSGSTDTFGVRTNSSRALWANSNGLVVVDPGTAGLENVTQYTLNFSDSHLRFGFGIRDQGFVANSLVVEIFAGGGSIGSIGLTSLSTDLVQFYLESDVAFDQVVINATLQNGGFAIDNLTLETVTAPVPPILPLFVLGLLGIARHRRQLMQT